MNKRVEAVVVAVIIGAILAAVGIVALIIISQIRDDRSKTDVRMAITKMHLKTLGMAIQLYSEEWNGRLPQKLDDCLVHCASDAENAARMLVSPFSKRKVTVSRDGPAWRIDGQSDYIYIRYDGKLADLKPPEKVMLAYERPENFKNEKTNVFYADGHIETVDIAKFRALLGQSETIQASSSQPAEADEEKR